MTKIDDLQLYTGGLYCYNSVLNKIAKQNHNDAELNEFTKEMLRNLEPFNEECLGFAEVILDAFANYKKMKTKNDITHNISDVKSESFAFTNIQFFAPDDHLVLNSIKNHLNKLKLQYFVLFYAYKADNKNQIFVNIALKNILGLEEHNSIIATINSIITNYSQVIKDDNIILSNFKSHKNLHSSDKGSERMVNFVSVVSYNKLFKFFSSVEFNNEQITKSLGIQDLFSKDTMISLLKLPFEEGQYMKVGQIISSLPGLAKPYFLDYIILQNTENKAINTIFFGLYDGYYLKGGLRNILLLRDKIDLIATNENLIDYEKKKLESIVESLPNNLLFNLPQNELNSLLDLCLVVIKISKIKIFLYHSTTSQSTNILLLANYSRRLLEFKKIIKQYLENKFQQELIIKESANRDFDYINVIIVKPATNLPIIDINILEQELNNLTISWADLFRAGLLEKYDKTNTELIFQQYYGGFNENYRAKYSVAEALKDVENCKRILAKGNKVFQLDLIAPRNYYLTIYALEKISLSEILPILDNFGFKTSDVEATGLNFSRKIWLHKFSLESTNTSQTNELQIKNNLEEAFYDIEEDRLASDSLIRLIILAGLNSREVTTIKALTRYLHQTGFSYGKGYVQLTLIKHYEYSKFLVKLLSYQFNPAEFNEVKIKETKNKLITYLDGVSSASEDQVLRTMYHLVCAMLRTNIFQKQENEFKKYMSFKFSSSKILHLVKPLPYAEIYVYNDLFEGVHLRGGKVARGGLRWSDRGEDYRVEVLGLMKAQMPKNAVIVPTGSKGCFVLKIDATKITKEEYKNLAIDCYKNFLRGLLDLTDNIIDGKIVSAKDLVILDEQDPYLVVAADKGTASFSDYANSVSAEYDFWLQDAFASGGSKGYDHKKLAITSKGAWIAACRHFADMNININTENITLVGIGDMSGDVFGNFMLRSKTLKLVAAFNHSHIFIDPTPDPEKSYKERERMFNLPTSQWSDYNLSILSKGGGVFSRDAKMIQLSNEAQEVLDIDHEQLSPDELINAILKAPIDLLINGGIGTYIKAKEESHIDIGDKANENLRCNGSDIRAKVIVEGGNIGVSQLGRVEYSRQGGKINTDFIDNSAGVDCSDHEVNIKIILNLAVKNKVITFGERDDLLKHMSKQVEELVLEDNYKQTRAITIMENAGSFNLEMLGQNIKSLESSNILDRKVEFLPDDKNLADRERNLEKLTRPELAVILSYNKMSCSKKIISSDILAQDYFKKFLIEYFPKMIQDQFKEFILSGPLSKEIIATVITNKFINRLSGPLVNYIESSTNKRVDEIICQYFITEELFGIEELWKKVEALDDNKSISAKLQIELFSELLKILRRGTVWLLKNNVFSSDIRTTVSEYKNDVLRLIQILPELLLGSNKERFEKKLSYYIEQGLEKDFAYRMSSVEFLVSIFDILSMARKTNLDKEHIAKMYFAIGNELFIDWLRRQADNDKRSNSYWFNLSKQVIKDDLYQKQRNLLYKVISESQEHSLDYWVAKNQDNYDIVKNFVNLLKQQKILDLNMIIVANKKLELLLI